MLTLKVAGMSCGHCVRTVTRVVEALPAVTRAVVTLENATVVVEGDADETAVRQAIEDAGFVPGPRL